MTMSEIRPYTRAPWGSASSRDDGGSLALRILGPIVWFWATAVVIGLGIFLAMLMPWFLGLLMGVFVASFLAPTVGYLVESIRRARGMVVLAYLENAVRLNLLLV